MYAYLYVYMYEQVVMITMTLNPTLMIARTTMWISLWQQQINVDSVEVDFSGSSSPDTSNNVFLWILNKGNPPLDVL